MHVYSTKFKKNVNLPYAKVGKQVLEAYTMPKPIAGKTALTRIQRLNTGTIQTLETNVQKSPNIKKPFFAVLKAKSKSRLKSCVRILKGIAKG